MEVSTSNGSVPMPILYDDSEMITSLYSAPTRKIIECIPGNKAFPLQIYPGRGLVMFSYVDHHKTSIGPYREFSVGFPIRYKQASNIPFLSVLKLLGTQQESHTWQLFVSTPIALSAGNELMACNKIMCDMKFKRNEREVSGSVSENGRHIITLTARKLPAKRTPPYCMQMVNYSGPRDGEFVCMPYNVYLGSHGMSLRSKASRLRLGTHPVAEQINSLKLSKKPVITIYSPSIKMVLPFPEKRVPV